MPRPKLSAGLTSLIESDSEPDFDSFEAVGAENLVEETRAMSAPNATKRGRPPANRVTKPAQRAVPQKRGAAAARAKAIEKEVGNESVVSSQGKPRGRPKASKTSGSVETTQNGTAAKGRRGRPPKGHTNEAPDSQTPEKHDASHIVVMEVDELEDGVLGSTRPASKHNHPEDLSLDDYPDDDDSSLRQRLENMSRKYVSLQARHHELGESVVKEAERNFDRLKKQAEAANASANKLIAELRAELAIQTRLADQGRETQHQLDLSEADRSDLESQIATLDSALADAKKEAKALTVKLSAARNADVKVPGSALKNKAASAAAGNADAVKVAQLKEDLYGDLTGLIVRGLQRDGDEDIFDCIQTGRNGTLHFKLALYSLEEVDNYEDVECTYRPQLDPDRDEALMNVLPEYLLEEITFPRNQASKFYTRVTRSLTERPE